ncbi:MAG: FdhF/YdeP family oxidoreductase [Spirochaetes bacterium]|nr:FdhF/YdeP family oxidoreductase [Spirochaetota bacterium]
MPAQPEKPSRTPPVAGGFAALASSARHLIKEKAVVKGNAALLRLNQPDGFDCPGCAWPEPFDTSRFEYCENGVKAIAAETTGKKADADFFARHTLADLSARDDYWLEQQGRLTEPLRFDAETNKYMPITWNEAFALIAAELRALPCPDAAAFYTSGRTSNEAAFLYQLFVREFGTNNLPDCSNMCHESSGVALTETVGVGKGTITLEDFEKCDAIFILGQNPGTNHPRMLSELEKARKRGCEIVTFNPLREAGLIHFTHPKNVSGMLTGTASPISSLYLQVKIGGDLAALKGICKIVIEKNALDHDFIRNETSGFEDLCADLEKTTWPEIAAVSGLSRDELETAAGIFMRSKSVIACWAMGLTQHKQAVATIQYVSNLLLLGGHIGRPGAGLCPVRGHSNVQGDRTMGITEKPGEEFLTRLGRAFAFEPPRAHGLDVVDTIRAMAAGKVKAFIAMGGNFAAATPDTLLTERALRQCRLTVHISTKLNRSHLAPGEVSLILPCLGRSERDLQNGIAQSVTVEDSMSMVHASRGRNAPASAMLLSEPRIVAELARHTLPDSKTPWLELAADHTKIRDRIAEVLPAFADFNRKILNPGGFYLGNTARERRWLTPEKKAVFKTAPLQPPRLENGELALMTIRSHDQYNTTIYGLNDRYRNIKNERRVLFIRPDDAGALGFKNGARVDITSRDEQGVRREAKDFRLEYYDIPQGCVAAYFPETNLLVSIDSVAEKSNTPVSKLIPVLLHARSSKTV